ncbi:phage head closure protein [Aneurinibacillus sp. BA2021]|nr:phage head closure protein [Aneurinibacillus sp. BA2021]
MRIGKLNKRITIQRVQTEVVGVRLKETWFDVASRWAFIDNMQSSRIVIRHMSEVERGMRILYGKKIFDIEDISDIEERSKEMHLTVKEVDMSRFDVPVLLYRLNEKKGQYNLVSANKELVATVMGRPIFADAISSNTDGKPIEFNVIKKVQLPLDTDVRIGEEINLGGRQYLIKDVISNRHWLDVTFEAEVIGHDRH